jgi:mRNA interferase MazF
MQKDFNGWNDVKIETNAEEPRRYTVRELWWCRIGINIGSEQDGKGEEYARPCLILRGFGPDACLAVPLSTSSRVHPLRIAIGEVDGKQARANLSQIRVIDTRRLVRKIGFLNKDTFEDVRKAAKGLL